MPHSSSFTQLKVDLANWITTNQNSVQLDGSTSFVNNPVVVWTFNLAEAGGLENVIIKLHGDTKKAAIDQLINCDIKEFIICPPSPNHIHWRFHHKLTHAYANDNKANGLYSEL